MRSDTMKWRPTNFEYHAKFIEMFVQYLDHRRYTVIHKVGKHIQDKEFYKSYNNEVLYECFQLSWIIVNKNT